MKPALLATIGLFTMVVSNVATAATTYRGSYRPLFVFAETGSASLARQRTIVAAHRSGLLERNVIVVWVVGDAVSSELGPQPAATARTLRTRHGVPSRSFRAVLVGKDGGAKLTRSEPLTTAALFSTIDAMPMRREEMRRN